MDRATVTLDEVTGSLKVTDSGGTVVPGSVSWSVDDKTVTFTPSSDLVFDTVYTITVTTAVTDAAGSPLAADFASQFTTRSRADGWFGGGGCVAGGSPSAAASVLIAAVAILVGRRRRLRSRCGANR
jgi:hypothetical protein